MQAEHDGESDPEPNPLKRTTGAAPKLEITKDLADGGLAAKSWDVKVQGVLYRGPSGDGQINA